MYCRIAMGTFKEKIYVCLYLIQSSTILEFNHNLIWAGVKLFNFSRTCQSTRAIKDQPTP